MSSAERTLVADFSLGLINQTGAYHISKDIVDGCRDVISETRYWRFRLRQTPSGLARKILGRMMLFEYKTLRDRPFLSIKTAHPATTRIVYFDPLYVLRGELRSSDIVLCHDVGPITHSKFFPATTVELYKKAYTLIQERAPGMVFVSDTSKREFVKLYGDAFRFMEVIPLYPRTLPAYQAMKKVPGLTRPFLLCVAALEHRKNHLQTFDAFLSSDLSQAYDLVVCGPRGNSTLAVETAARGEPAIKILGQVGDDELAWLYDNATGFVLPSLLEGFGVPVIEAAQRGLPCVTSQGSALEEAIGGHAVLVDPNDTQSIRAGMERLVAMDPAEKDTMVSAAKAHAETLNQARFLDSWRRLLERERGAETA